MVGAGGNKGRGVLLTQKAKFRTGCYVKDPKEVNLKAKLDPGTQYDGQSSPAEVV